jgi:hypothetical protein
VPMLCLKRSDWIREVCEHFNLVRLLTQDMLLLESNAIREDRRGSPEHEMARWTRLELLRFVHVEGDSELGAIKYDLLADIWQRLPSEVSCKWLRILADSGEALTEADTETAFHKLVCGADLPRLGKHGFNCFEVKVPMIRLNPHYPTFVDCS